MRKILILSIILSVIIAVNAQQVNYLETIFVSTKQQVNAQIDVSLIKKGNKLNSIKYKKPPRKSDVNYSQPYYLSNLDFAYLDTKDILGADNNLINLFPDSLAFSYYEYTNLSPLNSKQVNIASTGFVFDPYSKSFDPSRNNGFFLTDNTFHGYKIDTIVAIIDYRIANYNPASPDTLRFYISSHDVYYPGTNYDKE